MMYFATIKSSGSWKCLRLRLYPRTPCNLSGASPGAAAVLSAEGSDPTPAPSTFTHLASTP